MLAVLLGLAALLGLAQPGRAADAAVSAKLADYLVHGSPQAGAIDAGGLAGNDPYPLYNVELYTQPLIIWLKGQPADDPQARTMLDQLCGLYFIPFGYLKPAAEAGSQAPYRGWLAAPDDTRFAKQYRGQETLLYSVQYLYAVSQLLRLVSLVPPAERTADEQRLLTQAPFVADTYQRWLGGDRRSDLQNGKLADSLPVSDKAMQAASGMLELLLAVDNSPADFPIERQERQRLRGFVDSFWQRFASRMQTHADGSITWDEAWGTDPKHNTDYVAAGWTDPDNPPARLADCPPLQHLSYDLSHGIRLIWTLDSFSRQAATQADAARFTAGLARHFVAQVWNGDLQAPRFTNYFSGDQNNGWYRARFDAQGNYIAGSGTKPWGLGAIAGPYYFLWSPYNADLRQLADAYAAQHQAALAQPRGWNATLQALEYLPCVLYGGQPALPPASRGTSRL
jgi:hypothetical protein